VCERVTAQTLCPLCGDQTWQGKATRFVLNGVSHSAPSIWLAGSVHTRDAVSPGTSALEHYRDAMEAWAEQCRARGEQ
jgi:hypothetical protein